MARRTGGRLRAAGNGSIVEVPPLPRLAFTEPTGAAP